MRPHVWLALLLAAPGVALAQPPAAPRGGEQPPRGEPEDTRPAGDGAGDATTDGGETGARAAQDTPPADHGGGHAAAASETGAGPDVGQPPAGDGAGQAITAGETGAGRERGARSARRTEEAAPERTPADAAEAVERPAPGIPTGADEAAPGPTEEVRELPPAVIQGPLEEEPPLLETWSFWVAIGAVAVGIALAIIVDVTTDDPRPSVPEDPDGASMGLTLRF